MTQQGGAVIGWPVIIGVMIATGLVTGVILGLTREVFGFTGGTAGVGASIGIVGALLIARRRAQLRARQA
jgi:hypothetical protein